LQAKLPFNQHSSFPPDETLKRIESAPPPPPAPLGLFVTHPSNLSGWFGRYLPFRGIPFFFVFRSIIARPSFFSIRSGLPRILSPTDLLLFLLFHVPVRSWLPGLLPTSSHSLQVIALHLRSQSHLSASMESSARLINKPIHDLPGRTEPDSQRILCQCLCKIHTRRLRKQWTVFWFLRFPTAAAGDMQTARTVFFFPAPP